MKKVLAIATAFLLILSAVPATALASSNYTHRDVNYSQTLTVGEAASKAMALSDAYITTEYLEGYAAGFNAELIAGKEYMASVVSTTPQATLHELTIVVLRNTLAGGYMFNGDALTPNVAVVANTSKAATAVRFTPETTGSYKILVIEDSMNNTWNVGATCSVKVEELSWKDYRIASADDYVSFRNSANNFDIFTANARLSIAADIDLLQTNVVPIKYFSGIINGNGRTISNAAVLYPQENNMGLIGMLYGGASVSNLNLVNFKISAHINAGALAGTVMNAALEDITSSGTIETVATQAGGIAGEVCKNVSIEDCSSSSNVRCGTSQGGGLIGSASSHVTIEDCKTTGTVSGVGSVGGLCGTTNSYITIEDCESTSAVSGSTNCGGLAGYAGSSTVFKDCTASGNVTGTLTCTGGFVGDAGATVSFENCSANGIVTGASTVGGFAGSAEMSIFNMCVATQQAIKGNYKVGGFVGFIGSSVKIINSYASGPISNLEVLHPLIINPEKVLNTDYGAFAGSVSGISNTITNCFTISPLNVSAHCVGGFIGVITLTGKIEVRNCYTSSDMTINNSTLEFGAFLGADDSSDKLVSTFPKVFIDNSETMIVNSETKPIQFCNGYVLDADCGSVTYCRFDNADHVKNMTDSLNETAGNEEELLSWGGSNASNGPNLIFPEPDPENPQDEMEDVIDWVKSQFILFQIPLWVFYVPVMYLVSTVRSLF